MIEDKLHSNPLVSVLVMDYNGQRFWPKLLEALAGQRFRDFELVVVENGEALDLPASVGEIPVLRLKTLGNLGFAGGVNFAAARARGQWLALLNNDTVPHEDWLWELARTLRSDSSAGAVCSKVLFYDRYARLEISAPVFCPESIDETVDSRLLGVRVRLPEDPVALYTREGTYQLERNGEEVWVWTREKAALSLPLSGQGEIDLRFSSHPSQAGKRATFRILGGESQTVELSGAEQRLRFTVGETATFDALNSVGNRFDAQWNVVELGLYERDGEAFSRAGELELACACSLLLRRSALAGEIFDSEFFAYFEDADLSCRLRRDGWRILYEPRSVVRHYGSATAGRQSAFQVFHSMRNRLWVVALHAPWRVVVRSIVMELTNLERFGFWLDAEYSLARLKREAWTGFFKRLWRRLCDSD